MRSSGTSGDGACLLQASEMVGVCNVLQTVADPLSLSLALDICEEVLQAGEGRRVARRIARAGALAALVNAPDCTVLAFARVRLPWLVLSSTI